MKRRYILLSLFIVPAMLFAMPLVVGHRQPPSLSLPAAYNLALGALGAETNQFYCVQAATYANRDSWTFTFCTTNSTPQVKCVVVDFDGKTHFEPSKAIR
jgi:hypothetical protein